MVDSSEFNVMDYEDQEQAEQQIKQAFNINNVPRKCIVCGVNKVKTSLKTPVCAKCRHMDAHPNDLEALKRFKTKETEK